jgi:Bacterial Ig-like domain (group 1)
VRLDNVSDTPFAVDGVVVDLQRTVVRIVDPRQPVPPVFNYWGSFVIPPHGSAILTQTAFINFDTSDYPIFGCGQFLPDDTEFPKITVTSGGRSTSYLDLAHIIDTFGYDHGGFCGPDTNESLQWREIAGSASTSPGQLALAPAAAANPLGALYTATAAATDAGGSPLAGVTVVFTVASGPNAGLTAQAVTDANGLATFSYTGTTAGTDTLSAAITNASGGVIPSSPVTALWLPVVQLALTPPSATQAVGTPYNAILLATDGSSQPVAGLAVTFQIASGPNAGKTARQTTGGDGQTLYSYTSTAAGTDTLTASVGLQGGNALSATPVTATWTASSAAGFVLAPLSQSLPVGTTAGLTATLLGGNQQPLAGRAVTFTVTSGPDAGTTGQAITDAAGVAAFHFTGETQGSDLVQATTGQGGGMLTSNPATVAWTAVPTAVLYTGPSFGEYGDPLTLSARLTAATTGQPLAGQTLSFTFGTQTLTGVTDATGTATVSLTPTMNPGAVPLSIVFAGSIGYGGAAASVLVAIHRDDTALVYTGPAGVATGQPQSVTAVLTDAQSHAPLAGKTVTFTFGAVTASGTTDATGTAAATLAMPASCQPRRRRRSSSTSRPPS